MNFFFIVYLFLIGAVIGSFLNVCIYRIPRKLSIIKPPSNCPSCKQRILPKDNIPVLSYLFLRGKCRYCESKISPRYITVELISAFALSVFYILYGFSFMFFQVSILFYILLVLSWIDIDMGIVPLGIIVFGVIIGFALLIMKNGYKILPNIYGAGVGFLLVLISGMLGKILFKKEAIGGGDLYLTTMIGLYLGWKYIITAYFLSFLIAGIYSFYLVIKFKKLPVGHEIKLVPFLSFGGILGLTIGDKINNFYLENFIM